MTVGKEVELWLEENRCQKTQILAFGVKLTCGSIDLCLVEGTVC